MKLQRRCNHKIYITQTERTIRFQSVADPHCYLFLQSILILCQEKDQRVEQLLKPTDGLAGICNCNRFKTSLGLTLKAPVTTAADDIYKYFFIVVQRKIDLIFHVNPLLGSGFT